MIVLLLGGCGTPRPPPEAPEPVPGEVQTPRPAAKTSPSPIADTCSFAGDVADKYRWRVKHRDPAATTAKPVTIQEMMSWDDPDNADDASVRGRDDPNDLLNPREAEVRVLEAEIWVAKIESNDCDWHLEVSTVGAGENGDRIIAEISQGKSFDAARSQIAHLVGIREIKGQCFKFSEPARARLTGFAFYDGHHWSRKHPHVGWRHGSDFVKTLWELHPVWQVEVLAPGKAERCR